MIKLYQLQKTAYLFIFVLMHSPFLFSQSMDVTNLSDQYSYSLHPEGKSLVMDRVFREGGSILEIVTGGIRIIPDPAGEADEEYMLDYLQGTINTAESLYQNRELITENQKVSVGDAFFFATVFHIHITSDAIESLESDTTYVCYLFVGKKNGIFFLGEVFAGQGHLGLADTVVKDLVQSVQFHSP